MLRTAKYSEAEAAARRVRSEAEEAQGTESLRSAEALDLLVEALWRGGKAGDSETTALGERAIRIKESLLGGDDPALAKSLVNLGIVHAIRGEFSSARPLYERALRIQERALGPDHPDLAGTLNSLGILLRNTGNYPEARATLERSLSLRMKAGGETMEVASILSNLAGVYSNMGDLEESANLFERALHIREKILAPDHPVLGSNLADIAVVRHEMGDDAGARGLLERALSIQEKALGPSSPQVALTLENLGESLMYLGNLAEARSVLARALSIQEASLGKEHYETASTLRILATVSRLMGDAVGALPLAERSLAIRVKVLGAEHPDVAFSLSSVAWLKRDLGDWEGAELLFARSLAVREKALGSSHPDVASSLQELGELHLDLGDVRNARLLLDRALVIREKVLGPAHPDLDETLIGLARADAAEGRAAAGMEKGLRAATTARDYIQKMFRGLSESEALRLERIRAAGLDEALSILASGAPPVRGPDAAALVWDALVRSRALVLDEMAIRHRAAVEGGDPAIASLVETLDRERSRLARIVVRGPDADDLEGYRGRLSQSTEREEWAERALADRSSRFREERNRNQVGLREVVDAVPKGDVLVAYVAYTRRPMESTAGPGPASIPPPKPVRSYMALVLADGRPAAFELGEVWKIDGLVAAWRAEMIRAPEDRASEDRAWKAGENLRRTIWDPIAREVAGARVVFIVPDGGLNLVSFAALPAAGDRYLVEVGPAIHYLSAERDIVRPGVNEPSGRGVLIVGGPEFDLAPPISIAATAARHSEPLSSCDTFRGLRFAPLPGARSEADEVEALWSMTATDAAHDGDVVKLSGADAAEGVFKTKAPGRRILHIATHGFFMEGACRSALDPGIAAPATESMPDPWSPGGESPLLLAGLAFAGANRRSQAPERGGGEDGILTAGEIASLDLRGVEWAVLSSCGSGTGAIQAGEGVLGLRRTFQIAGVRTLVLSLWSVEDQAARDWIRRLYRNRLSGRTTLEAVRKTEIEILRTRRRAGVTTHPFFWGAFVAAGDWR